MTQNQNLHSTSKLTEFARDFEEEPDSIFGRFVNKIQNAYNQSYNTVNDLSSVNQQSPTSSNAAATKSVFYTDTAASPMTRDSSSSSLNSGVINQTAVTPTKTSSESSSVTTEDTTIIDKTDTLPMEASEGRTMVNVLKRIRTMMASKNNVSVSMICIAIQVVKLSLFPCRI